MAERNLHHLTRHDLVWVAEFQRVSVRSSQMLSSPACKPTTRPSVSFSRIVPNAAVGPSLTARLAACRSGGERPGAARAQPKDGRKPWQPSGRG